MFGVLRSPFEKRDGPILWILEASLRKSITWVRYPKMLTADMVSLCASILHVVGLRALKETLDKRDGKTILTEKLLKMAEFVLKNNYFEFGDKTTNLRICNWD